MSKPASEARQFEMELEIEATRDDVWKALAEGPEVARWFAPEARVSGGVGGEVVWRWGESHSWPQKIEIWEPGQRLKTSYSSGVDDGAGGHHPLFVDFHLRGDGGRTTLRLVHSGFGPGADFETEYDGISRGWPVELRSLRLYLENHRGLDRYVAWTVKDISIDAARAWSALTGPAGLNFGAGLDRLASGADFAFTTADGDVFEGRALTCSAREFSGMAVNWNRAFMRFVVENCGGQWQVWLWLAAYGEDMKARVDALRGRFDAMADRLFDQQGQAAASQ